MVNFSIIEVPPNQVFGLDLEATFFLKRATPILEGCCCCVGYEVAFPSLSGSLIEPDAPIPLSIGRRRFPRSGTSFQSPLRGAPNADLQIRQEVFEPCRKITQVLFCLKPTSRLVSDHCREAGASDPKRGLDFVPSVIRDHRPSIFQLAQSPRCVSVSTVVTEAISFRLAPQLAFGVAPDTVFAKIDFCCSM